jgi:hypothetical protein
VRELVSGEIWAIEGNHRVLQPIDRSRF